MQKEDFNWFRENLEELFKKYPNRQVVISNKEVLKDFNDFEEALYWAIENVGVGKFIIQKCTETEEGFTIHVNPRYYKAEV